MSGAGLAVPKWPGPNQWDLVVAYCSGQLRVSNLSKVDTQLLEVDSNLQPSGNKAQNTSLHHHVPLRIDRCIVYIDKT